MTKFLLIYTAPAETREKMQTATPEEMKAGMQPWMEWFTKIGDKLVDKGMPLMNTMTVTKDDVIPGNVDVVAYNVIQAESIDEAVEIAKTSPHLDREGSAIEVHEMMPMPGLE